MKTIEVKADFIVIVSQINLLTTIIFFSKFFSGSRIAFLKLSAPLEQLNLKNPDKTFFLH